MREINEARAVLDDVDLRRAYDRQRAIDSIADEARAAEDGPAPADASTSQAGSPLDFGRYAGWTIGALSRHDPDYLRWLVRMPIGRRYSAEVERLLRPAVPVMDRPDLHRRRFGRGTRPTRR